MERQTSAERFVERVNHVPLIGLKIVWGFGTFGCFSCILGALWYMNNWFQYVHQLGARPFNVLERQMNSDDGTVVPSNATGRISLDAIAYQNKNSSFLFDLSDNTDYWFTNDTTSNDPGDEMLMFNLTYFQATMSEGRRLDSMNILLTHLSPQPNYPWIQAGILHPLRKDGEFSRQDSYNQYFFRPGHYLEISYTPLQIEQPLEVNATSSFGTKLRYYLGYNGQETIYTYRSSAQITPFPVGEYDNTTTVIIIRPQAPIEIMSTMNEKVSFRDALSSIGGLIGIAGSAIGFLFGASLLSPWGFVAGLPFFRKRISGSLAKAYDNENGLSKGPFTTPFEETGQFDSHVCTNEEKLAVLKERIDELEMVLGEFYLDGGVFKDYATERRKLNISRKASLASRSRLGGHKESFNSGHPDQTVYQQTWNSRPPLTLPSQTLMESQHQHRGQLPSPQFPPSYVRQSQESPRRHSSEPSVLDYYQQQLQNQHRKHRSDSEQSLLRPLPEEEEYHSPRQDFGTSEHDQQSKGLLQQDHHTLHQAFLQQQEQRIQQLPKFPPRPPKGSILPMTIDTPLESSSLLSPSPPSSAHDDRGSSAWWKSDGADRGSVRNTSTSRSYYDSPSQSNLTETTGGMHIDMSDLSRMPREQ
ncbi:hypothetical protein BGZ46_003842 [Entomortierella lignicola]|nr:hypothetical protein BGZ46_003842 [Entomortierella lignicola]